jgi:hypothetical protein
MPDTELPELEASVRPTVDFVLFSICGLVNHIIADPGIVLENLVPADPQAAALQRGKLIVATAPKGTNIGVDSDYRNHIFTLTCKGKEPIGNELLIRIPIGLRFYLVVGDDGKAPEDTAARSFYAETVPGYNIVPHFAPANTDEGQAYPELLLLVTPEPPRQKTFTEIKQMTRDKEFATLTEAQQNLLQDLEKAYK